MSEWKKVRLGEVAELCLGKMLDAKKNKGTLRPYLNNVAVRWGCFDLVDLPKMRIEDAEVERYKIKKGDIVICEGGEPGRCAVWRSEEPIFFQKALHRARVKPCFDSDFIYYQLCYLVKSGETRNFETGSTIRHLPAQELKQVPVNLPPLATQRKIAAVLSSLDDKIKNNRKICANLEAQAQAIFKSWFVDFEPFGGKMPQGWKMGKLGDVGNIVGGATPSKAKAEFYTEEGIAWLTPKDLSLQQTKFVAKGEIDITEEGYKSASVRMLPKGSVLFSSRAPIGYVAIAKNELCTNQGFKSVVPFDWVGSEFVYQLLRMMTPVIEERASGSTFKEISSSGMKVLPVIVPSKNVLHEFSSITLPMGESQKSLEDETRTLAAMRDALLPKLMSGEIDVEKVKISA